MFRVLIVNLWGYKCDLTYLIVLLTLTSMSLTVKSAASGATSRSVHGVDGAGGGRTRARAKAEPEGAPLPSSTSFVLPHSRLEERPATTKKNSQLFGNSKVEGLNLKI